MSQTERGAFERVFERVHGCERDWEREIESACVCAYMSGLVASPQKRRLCDSESLFELRSFLSSYFMCLCVSKNECVCVCGCGCVCPCAYVREK